MSNRAERWDLLAWWDAPGREAKPVILAYGVTVRHASLDADIVTVTKRLRSSARRVTLYRGNEKRHATVVWDDCLKPARWGGASFRLT